jgi:lipopolysaccharide/colanic/teichoic acid biosynthesis glycosyltransferase
MWRRGGKRLFDIAAATVLGVVAAPLACAAAAFVWATLGRPVLFRQRRPGLGGAPFTLLKFRTMHDARDPRGVPLADAARLTAAGRWLRRTSLDELPQLVNVLRGDMSLVGPRPLLMEYLPLYDPQQARRHEVRPGITGWAQVRGRNALSWDEKFALDAWYVDRVGFALDMRILLLTVARLWRSEGVSQPGHCTAEKFRGNA